jgi:GrpB-like predicted nucleotidyltransferase (UPF0157 family)
MLGLEKGKVQLEDYNPVWQENFEREKRLLLENLGERIVDVEHVGSTAVLGMLAKPIIDIDVGVAMIIVESVLVFIFENKGHYTQLGVGIMFVLLGVGKLKTGKR